MAKSKCRREDPSFGDISLVETPREFVADGYLKIVHHGAPFFILDNVQLGELVRYHFKPEEQKDGFHIGKCKVIIIPLAE